MKKWLLNQHPIIGLTVLFLMLIGAITGIWAVLFLVGTVLSFSIQTKLNVIQASTITTIVFYTLYLVSGVAKDMLKTSEFIERWTPWIVSGISVLIWVSILVFSVPK